MNALTLTTDEALLLTEVLKFWIDDYEATGARHSMMTDAKRILNDLRKINGGS